MNDSDRSLLALDICDAVDHIDVENDERQLPQSVRLTKSEKRELKSELKKYKLKQSAQAYKLRRKERRLELESEEGMDRQSPKLYIPPLPNKPLKSEILEKLSLALQDGLNVCFDLSFDHEHDPRERLSLAKQLSLSYGIVKKAQSPLHLHLCSFEGLDAILIDRLHCQGLHNWKVDIHDREPCDVFAVEQLIFLTPDAEETLEDIDSTKVHYLLVSSRFSLSLTSLLFLCSDLCYWRHCGSFGAKGPHAIQVGHNGNPKPPLSHSRIYSQSR
jgi:hypothetical protein